MPWMPAENAIHRQWVTAMGTWLAVCGWRNAWRLLRDPTDRWHRSFPRRTNNRGWLWSTETKYCCRSVGGLAVAAFLCIEHVGGASADIVMGVGMTASDLPTT